MDKKTLFDIIKNDSEIQKYKDIIRKFGKNPPPFSMFTEGLEEYKENLKRTAEDCLKNKQ